MVLWLCCRKDDSAADILLFLLNQKTEVSKNLLYCKMSVCITFCSLSPYFLFFYFISKLSKKEKSVEEKLVLLLFFKYFN